MRIEAKDLRIGNKVGFSAHSPTEVVDAEGQGTVTSIHEGCWLNEVKFDYYNLRGIELTPEILEKCGFEKTGKIYGSDKFKIYEIKTNCFIPYFGALDSWELTRLKPIYYLHQLQNTCYALCGEDLQVKL